MEKHENALRYAERLLSRANREYQSMYVRRKLLYSQCVAEGIDEGIKRSSHNFAV